MRDRILFILKRREDSWGGAPDVPGYGCRSSGLLNSVSFIVAMLVNLGVDARMVEVEDNNAIDREVTRCRPTHVVIEAFWVVPEKFDVLMPLHPSVRWMVRNHSETPFLANEGIAFGWIAGYLKRGIELMCNAPRAMRDVRALALAYGFHDRMVSYAPNFYPIAEAGRVAPHLDRDRDTVEIGCFGAVRPLKNHVMQAIAAIMFARTVRKRLRFHINGSRIEGGGNPILKNLRAMFAACPDAELVEHAWLPHADFLNVLDAIDIALQVSFTETFNIVAADAAARSVPVVVSNELPWIGAYAHADPTSAESIGRAMLAIWDEPSIEPRLHRQRRELARYCDQTEQAWRERFRLPEHAF